MTAPIEPEMDPPFSEERDERTEIAEDDGMVVPGLDVGYTDEQKRGAEALYGPSFPFLNDDPSDDDFVTWAEQLWVAGDQMVRKRLWIAERNRLFRIGMQWVSSRGFGTWREPPKPENAARVVHNLVGPSLDQRVQLVSEQRPGFRTKPSTMDQSDQKRAEAQQIALEAQYSNQNMPSIVRELAYWSGTDGVAFGEVYWDPEAGPWHEWMDGQKTRLGDVRTRVLRIEHVRVSPNATYTQRPWYWIIREVMATGEAVRLYGHEVAGENDGSVGIGDGIELGARARLGYQLPLPDERLEGFPTVYRYKIYCEPSEFLPQGLYACVVGKKLVHADVLMQGVVPVFCFRDGSTDPAFFPAPIMETWIDCQMRINAVLSKWVENIRYNATPRLLAKMNAIEGETLLGGTTSVISVRGLGQIGEVVKELGGMSLASDAKELIAFDKKTFEDLSGYNDTSRGQFSSEQSGRAILAIREQLERIFAPPINAAADAMVEWAKITLAFLAWGYDVPRQISAMGTSRADLGMMLSRDDFDGTTDVEIDPETMMPMPRSLRLVVLDDMLQKGLMSVQEYRRRMPFALLRDMRTPDEDHEARARRCAMALAQGQELPILWQDNEAIHQDVLERELILPDDVPMEIRQAAMQRWFTLAQQSMMKTGLMMSGAMPPGELPSGGIQGGGFGQQIPESMTGAQSAPFTRTNPSLPAPKPELASASQPDERRIGNAFDAAQPI